MALSRVGPYKLLRVLGEGGAGVVHLAKDRRSGEKVALKLLRPNFVGDDEGRERLEREVRSLSRVRSAWIAEIRDADPWGDIAYIATRYVPGLSLHDTVLDAGPILSKQAPSFALGLAYGVAACHAVGVLHRDIKPSNVLMEGKKPILIDFGLARVADDSKITQTGWLMGTPGYLPPEILDGEDATPATDVHSWAATVAFATSGRAPFGHGPSVAIMDRTRRGDFDVSGVPANVRDIVIDALAPNPADRPSLDEIISALGGTPRSATQPETAVLTRPLLAADNDAPTDTVRSRPATATTAQWLRRVLTWVLLAFSLAGAVRAWPWIAAIAAAALVWLTASGSIVANAHQQRRAERGAKWYDLPRLIVHAPASLVQSLPTVLTALFACAAVAAIVIYGCYLFDVDRREVALPLAGALAGLTAMVGPAGPLLRPPITGLVNAVSHNTKIWAPFAVVLAAFVVFASLV